MKWFILGMVFMWWLDWSGLVTSHDIASFVDRESKAIAADILAE